ncbi:MAG: MerR family transcriptional regulator [Bacteroidales bacterium]|nr:MerR family transcriptional regulator [Bacteroidales bacterium]MBR5831092.1 MerR family transcriptional regulator [Bacteroidales bacterium]
MEKLYYSIGEVAEMLNVAPSLLRFWETEFDCIKPHKNKKGNRYYTLQDIEILRKIYYLTKECGFTLDGAKEQLKKQDTINEKAQLIDSLANIRKFLVELKDQL